MMLSHIVPRVCAPDGSASCGQSEVNFPPLAQREVSSDAQEGDSSSRPHSPFKQGKQSTLVLPHSEGVLIGGVIRFQQPERVPFHFVRMKFYSILFY